ncbi:MAG TPA: hypothetical protein VMS99_01015 [Acidimicrobiia bacterium]|nr:hypothetical protein [Acidimicrobiia bacterium]
MSRAARSIQVWSIYVLIVGAGLAVIPNLILSTLGVAQTDEVWIRVLGVVVVVLALYYWDAARHETRNLFVASVLGRLFVVASLLVLWLTGEPWQLLLFAAVEAAGALWTFSALRADAEA